MVNIKATKTRRQWMHPLNGSRNIAEIRVGKRGTEYFCMYFDLHSKFPKPVIELRLSTLKDAATWVCQLAEDNNMPADWLESLLDFIYLELNRRLNKTLKEGE